MFPRQVRIGASVGLFAVASVHHSAMAQELLLQIRPRAGDTLRMRLDQETDYSGGGVTRTGVGPGSLVTTMAMFSRAIIEGESNDETAILAVTDSVRLWTTDQRGLAAAHQMEAQLRGQRVRFRVTPEGLLAMEPASGAPREVAHVVSLMPATFPKGPIKVGDSWMREMPLPAGTQLGAQLSGTLHVTLQLDSVTHGGDLAFISMRGEMQPATGPGAASQAILEKGTVRGTMVLDRRRGWLSESWFSVVVMTSVITPPAAAVRQMQTRITQHMRTTERRER
jgi:hypothetical protein